MLATCKWIVGSLKTTTNVTIWAQGWWVQVLSLFGATLTREVWTVNGGYGWFTIGESLQWNNIISLRNHTNLHHLSTERGFTSLVKEWTLSQHVLRDRHANFCQRTQSDWMHHSRSSNNIVSLLDTDLKSTNVVYAHKIRGGCDIPRLRPLKKQLFWIWSPSLPVGQVVRTYKYASLERSFPNEKESFQNVSRWRALEWLWWLEMEISWSRR